jgi:site-specific DNA-methyltransferase (adenine-specific)
MINITNEDNMDLMARYEDNYFDLAIVDPPYGIGESSIKRDSVQNGTWANPKQSPYTQKNWDNERPTPEYFKELFRVSKNQIIWGGNYFTDYLPPTMGWVFWDKKVTGDFSKGELAFTSFNRALLKFEWLWSGYKKQKPEKRIHPTQKPVKLYEWLLMNYAQRKCSHKHRESERYLCTDCRNSDVKILDTHLGSGSIALACHNLGFDLTACELDKEYFEASLKRLKQHQQQLTMF